MQLRILGPLEVVAAGSPVPLGGLKARALLGYLLLHRGETVSRERLIEVLWGERRPNAVAAELRVYIAKLRKALPPELLVTQLDGYALHVDSASIDAEHFERASRRGGALLTAGDPVLAARVLADALTLWRGAALADLAQEPWAQLEACRLDGLRLLALEQRLEADLALGRHAAVVAELERLVAEQPYRERPRAHLMLALYRCGRQAEALELYRRTAQLFADELGIEPGRELRERERAILNHDPSLAAHELETGNLSVPPTPLLGRRRELVELAALVAEPHVRLVTLSGPGGSGKTRLALEVAARLRGELALPAFLVELAPLADAALVLPTIAQAVGVKELSGDHPIEALRNFLRHRPLLVVLDNFEHLLAAAPDVAELLAAVPSLTVLATSRQPLHIRAEYCFDVDPLPIDDALTLFVERARAVRRDFSPTAAGEDVCRQICERVDRLPLAIELAAARTRRTEPSRLLSRLDPLPHLDGGFRDAPDRQRTLWATIDWSYRLLSPEQQQLFARLSIFRGSFSVEAACSVCDAQLDVLETLADASLVATRGDRFFMLETIREFAETKVARNDRTAMRHRHADFFLGVAQLGRKQLTGADAATALACLDDELDNLRLAFEWWLEAQSPDQLLVFVNSLSRLFSVSARAEEGAAWVARALERTACVEVTPRLRVVALIRGASLEQQVGDFVAAERLYEQALALARDSHDPAGESAALTGLATMASMATMADGRVISMLERAVEIARDVGDERELAIGLDTLSRLHVLIGSLEDAAAATSSAMEIHQKLGDIVNGCVSLLQLANVALHRGQVDEAIASFRKSVLTGVRLRSPWLSGAGVEGVAAAVLAREGGHADVVRLLGASEALFAASELAERFSDGYFPTVSHENGAATLKATVEAEARRGLDAATYDHAWAEGRALEPQAAVELALAACDLSHRVAAAPPGTAAEETGEVASGFTSV